MGYVNLTVSRLIPPLSEDQKKQEIFGRTMHTLTLAESVDSASPSPSVAEGAGSRSSTGSLKAMLSRKSSSGEKSSQGTGVTEFVLALDSEKILQRWEKAIKQGINGEKIIPLYPGHGNPAEGSSSSGCSGATPQDKAKKVVNYPFKSGTMKKKAIGKKIISIRNWKVRYFKLEAGDLRYVRCYHQINRSYYLTRLSSSPTNNNSTNLNPPQILQRKILQILLLKRLRPPP